MTATLNIDALLDDIIETGKRKQLERHVPVVFLLKAFRDVNKYVSCTLRDTSVVVRDRVLLTCDGKTLTVVAFSPKKGMHHTSVKVEAPAFSAIVPHSLLKRFFRVALEQNPEETCRIDGVVGDRLHIRVGLRGHYSFVVLPGEQFPVQVETGAIASNEIQQLIDKLTSLRSTLERFYASQAS